MRRAQVYVSGRLAGTLTEKQQGSGFHFNYFVEYDGPPVSLTMPLSKPDYEFDSFPPFFDGLLPEGIQLEGLLRTRKLDEDDLFGQLIAVGGDLVGAITVEEVA